MAKNKKKFGRFEIPELRNASKSLFANIRFASIEKEIKTIVVTSSVMDEGKSTISTNLSCAIASSGAKVLIIDLDMRRRSLGHMLGMHNKNGVYGVLAGNCSIRDAVVATSYPNLYFMDCETNIPNPPDVLSTKRFESLLKILRDNYDYVILDTPPIGLFIDAGIVASQADGTILAVAKGRTPRKVVVDAAEQLNKSKANMLGVVTSFDTYEGNDYYYASHYYYTNEGEANGKPADESLITISDDIVSDDISDWADGLGLARKQRPGNHSKGVATTARTSQRANNPYTPGSYKTPRP